jgi:hypothetical protein
MSDTTPILACEDFIEAYQRLVDAARDEDEVAYDWTAEFGLARRIFNRFMGSLTSLPRHMRGPHGRLPSNRIAI